MPPAIKNNMTLGNILKILIAAVVSLTAMIGMDLIKSVEKIENSVERVKTQITAVEVTIAELKTEVKYLTKNERTGG
jgi:cell division protein FtsB